MPYKSDAMRRFFQLCKHHPEKAKKPCPDRKTIEKFEKHKGEKYRKHFRRKAS